MAAAARPRARSGGTDRHPLRAVLVVLEKRCPEASRRGGATAGLTKLVIRGEVGAIPLARLRSHHLDDLLHQRQAAGAAPATLNNLRALLRTVFAKAKKAGRWFGDNPVDSIERRKVPKRVYRTLSPEQIPSRRNSCVRSGLVPRAAPDAAQRRPRHARNVRAPARRGSPRGRRCTYAASRNARVGESSPNRAPRTASKGREADQRGAHFRGESGSWIGAGNGSRTRDPQLGKTNRCVCRAM